MDGKINRLFALFLIMLFVLNLPYLILEAQDHQESLKYNVSVNMMVVPLFAVDKKGNPVYDLKKDELRLYVNEKPVDISMFKHYEFGLEQEIKGETADTLQQSRDRVIFIILDSMFSSRTGYRRTKEIAVNLIKEGFPGDHFIALENHPVGGLKYIGSSGKDPEPLIKKIKKLSAPPDKWKQDIYSSRFMRTHIGLDPSLDPRSATGKFNSLKTLELNSRKQQYQNHVISFTHILSQFKYALKAIDKPKIVFLISEGVSGGAFQAAVGSSSSTAGGAGTSRDDSHKGFYSILNKDEPTVFEKNKKYSDFLFRYLVEVVKSLNNGGSVLYTINPRRMNDVNDDDASGEMSLRYLASESGGKYFAGSEPAKIVQRVKNTTAAYYELFYSLLPDMGGNMNVRLECTRKDVRVHSLIHTERNRPYHQMPPVRKKLFALNVVTNGEWSRIVGKVMKAKYKMNKTSKGEFTTIHVPLPKVMQNKKIDMFSIRMDPDTHKTSIDIVGSKGSDVVKLKFKSRKDKNRFFVIIEPTTPYCIYNTL